MIAHVYFCYTHLLLVTLGMHETSHHSRNGAAATWAVFAFGLVPQLVAQASEQGRQEAKESQSLLSSLFSDRADTSEAAAELVALLKQADFDHAKWQEALALLVKLREGVTDPVASELLSTEFQGKLPPQTKAQYEQAIEDILISGAKENAGQRIKGILLGSGDQGNWHQGLKLLLKVRDQLDESFGEKLLDSDFIESLPPTVGQAYLQTIGEIIPYLALVNPEDCVPMGRFALRPDIYWGIAEKFDLSEGDKRGAALGFINEAIYQHDRFEASRAFATAFGVPLSPSGEIIRPLQSLCRDARGLLAELSPATDSARISTCAIHSEFYFHLVERLHLDLADGATNSRLTLALEHMPTEEDILEVDRALVDLMDYFSVLPEIQLMGFTADDFAQLRALTVQEVQRTGAKPTPCVSFKEQLLDAGARALRASPLKESQLLGWLREFVSSDGERRKAAVFTIEQLLAESDLAALSSSTLGRVKLGLLQRVADDKEAQAVRVHALSSLVDLTLPWKHPLSKIDQAIWELCNSISEDDSAPDGLKKVAKNALQ